MIDLRSPILQIDTSGIPFLTTVLSTITVTLIVGIVARWMHHLAYTRNTQEKVMREHVERANRELIAQGELVEPELVAQQISAIELLNRLRSEQQQEFDENILGDLVAHEERVMKQHQAAKHHNESLDKAITESIELDTSLDNVLPQREEVLELGKDLETHIEMCVELEEACMTLDEQRAQREDAMKKLFQSKQKIDTLEEQVERFKRRYRA